MLQTSKRKMQICGWLQLHHSEIYKSPIRLQRFLFLYEAFSKTEDKENDLKWKPDSYLRTELSGSKIYRNGPIFTDVHNDYFTKRKEFDYENHSAYTMALPSCVNEHRANRVAFIINSLSDAELSNLIGQFDICSIHDNQDGADLNESDFSDRDEKRIDTLHSIYSDESIENNIIISINGLFFLFSRRDAKRITAKQLDALQQLSRSCQNTSNPIYMEIDKNDNIIMILK